MHVPQRIFSPFIELNWSIETMFEATTGATAQYYPIEAQATNVYHRSSAKAGAR